MVKCKIYSVIIILIFTFSNVGFAQTNVENYNFEYIPAEGENLVELIPIEIDSVITCYDYYPPEFNCDNLTLSEFVNNNLVYPKSMGKVCVQGKIIISFIVKKDGSLIDFKVEKSLHPDLDNEALRVMKIMPKWIPGSISHDKVTIPISIKF